MDATRRAAGNLVKMITGHLTALMVLSVSGLVIARVLGTASYGRYAAVMAVVSIVQVASSCGLPQVEVRYLAPMWRLGERSQAVTLASSLWTVRLLLSAGGGAVAAIWLGASPKLELSLTMCLMIGILSLSYFAHEATRSQFLAFGHAGKMSGLNVLRACLTLPVVLLSFKGWGLVGVFSALAVMYAALLAVNGWLLLRIAPLRPFRFQWPALRSYAGYSFLTFLGTMSGVVHAQFTVYAVANWATRQEAGFLAVALQLYTLVRGLFLAGRQALMPILAELEKKGQSERVGYWGELIMRYSAAATCLGVVGWALVGREAIRWTLTDAFAPVYSSGIVILVGAIFFCCAGSCIGLLWIREKAGRAAISNVILALVTLVGVAFALRGEGPGMAYRISWVYAGAGALYWGWTYSSLGLFGGIWLPLHRTVLLVLPAAVVWPVSGWEASFLARLAASAAFVALYGGLAMLFGLLPAGEMREILRVLRQGGRELQEETMEIPPS